MSAEQTEVVSQNMAVEFVAKLSAERTTANAANQPADDGAGDRTDSDANRAGDSAKRCAGLTACQRSADAASGTADGAYRSGDLHGVMEGSDFWGVTARTLQ